MVIAIGTRDLIRMIRSVLAYTAVSTILLSTAAVVHVSRALRKIVGLRSRQRPPGSIQVLVSGTFYNENWYTSHIQPLKQAATISVIHVVTERPLYELDKVQYVCPPRWVSRLLGRAPARAVAVLAIALRHRPDVMMGYHIMPNSLLCLGVSAMIGGKSVYQMTGGSTQVMGGGYRSENVLLRQLGRPYRSLERLLFHVLRQFDLIVVRGDGARAFLEENRLARSSLIITGGIDIERFCPADVEKVYDLAYVSRLEPCKGVEYFLNVLHHLRESRPGLRVAVVGGGSLMEQFRGQARDLGIEENVSFLGRRNDVPAILQSSRVFVLTSPSEGMSIAMLEAMAAGLPAAVTDVGDLRDAVTVGDNGLFLCGHDAEADASSLAHLLNDDQALQRMSKAARTTILERFSVTAIADRWDGYFARETSKAAATQTRGHEPCQSPNPL